MRPSLCRDHHADGVGSEFMRPPRCDPRRGREELSRKGVTIKKWCCDRPIVMDSEVEVVLRTGMRAGRRVFRPAAAVDFSTRDAKYERLGKGGRGQRGARSLHKLFGLPVSLF